MPRDNQWLLEHAANKHSQFGEDGVIAKVLDVIGDPIGWCVEFGAWDGKHLSNTYALIEDRDFSAVLIEGSAKKYHDLRASFRDNEKITPVHAFVGFGADDGLDQILAGTPIPREFDLLSIDIDGNDYHVWKAVQNYQPRIVVIEFNPTIPTAVDFVQPADMSVNQGSSLRAIANLAREKGYELVAVTECNGIFVREKYFPLFDIDDNAPEALRSSESLVSWVFCGYDGTVFIRGHGIMPWHGVPYRESKMQRVAKPFRKFPSNHGPLMRALSRYYRSLKKRHWF
jgi:hypothetical protein